MIKIWKYNLCLRPYFPFTSVQISLFQNLSPDIFLCLTEINTCQSGKVSDEIWDTWRCLAFTVYPDVHSGNQLL